MTIHWQIKDGEILVWCSQSNPETDKPDGEFGWEYGYPNEPPQGVYDVVYSELMAAVKAGETMYAVELVADTVCKQMEIKQ